MMTSNMSTLGSVSRDVANGIIGLLEQTQVWRGQDGRVYYVGELEDEHLGNIIAYLNRHAAELLERRRRRDHELETLLSVECALELEDADPLAWLHGRPLYRALLAEQRRRGAVDGEVVYPTAVVERARQLAVEHDDLADHADAVAARPATVENERELTELATLLERYRDAIRRLGEL